MQANAASNVYKMPTDVSKVASNEQSGLSTELSQDLTVITSEINA